MLIRILRLKIQNQIGVVVNDCAAMGWKQVERPHVLLKKNNVLALTDLFYKRKWDKGG